MDGRNMALYIGHKFYQIYQSCVNIEFLCLSFRLVAILTNLILIAGDININPGALTYCGIWVDCQLIILQKKICSKPSLLYGFDIVRETHLTSTIDYVDFEIDGHTIKRCNHPDHRIHRDESIHTRTLKYGSFPH